MGYYLRLFSKEKVQPTARAFLDALREVAGVDPRMGLHGGEEDWQQILIGTADGRNVCTIDRNSRDEDELVEEEIGEFQELLADSQPRRAAEWVSRYLDDVQTIYAIGFLEAGFDEDASPAPHEVLWTLKTLVGGISQADDEGMSNEDGFTAVWHFSDGVEGSWNFAVLEEDGSWRKVNFDLSDDTKRDAFLEGTL